MAWALLLAAGLLEVVWAYTMKLSHGFTRTGPAVVTLVAMLASFGLLSISMKTLPLGTAYTVWTGIGAVGAFIVGVAVPIIIRDIEISVTDASGGGRINKSVWIPAGGCVRGQQFVPEDTSSNRGVGHRAAPAWVSVGGGENTYGLAGAQGSETRGAVWESGRRSG